MSVKLSEQAYTLRLPRALKAVLVAMCTHANDQGGSCFPGVDTLAEKTAYCVRQVQRAQADLETIGLIVRVGNFNGGRGKTGEYQINLAAPIPAKGERITPIKREHVKHLVEDASTSVNPDILSTIAILENPDITCINPDMANENPDILSTETLTFSTRNPDILSSPYKTDARVLTVIEPSGLTVKEKIPPSLRSEAPEGAVCDEDVSAHAVEDGSQPAPGGKAFKRPSVIQVKAFFKSLDLTDEDADHYFDHFTSNGWKISGRAPMRDWQAAARNWKRNAPSFAPRGRSPTGTAAPTAEDAARRQRESIGATNAKQREEEDKAALRRIDAEIDALPPARLKGIRDKAVAMYTARGFKLGSPASERGIKAIMHTIYLEQKR